MKKYEVIYDEGKVGPSIRYFQSLDEIKIHFAGWENQVDFIYEIESTPIDKNEVFYGWEK